MPVTPDKSPECQKPGCTEDYDEKYKDEHGNRVKVCEKHYYRLVTRQTPVNITGLVGGGISKGSSSDRPLYEISKERDLNPNMGFPEEDTNDILSGEKNSEFRSNVGDNQSNLSEANSQ